MQIVFTVSGLLKYVFYQRTRRLKYGATLLLCPPSPMHNRGYSPGVKPPRCEVDNLFPSLLLHRAFRRIALIISQQMNVHKISH